MYFFNYQYRQLLKEILCKIHSLKYSNESIENDFNKQELEKINNEFLCKSYYSSEDEILKIVLMYFVMNYPHEIIILKSFIIDRILYYKKKNEIIILISSIIIAIIIILIISTTFFNKSFFRVYTKNMQKDMILKRA